MEKTNVIETQESNTVVLSIYSVKQSQLDKSVKYTFMTKYLEYLEFSLIDDSGSNRTILCVPSQTHCNLSCKFCQLTLTKKPVRNLTAYEIRAGVMTILGLLDDNLKKDTLLVSFMGAGEPLLNYQNVLHAADEIRDTYSEDFKEVQFAIATIIPLIVSLEEFTKGVCELDLDFKVHYSLHSLDQDIRSELMPSAVSNTLLGLEYLYWYQQQTNNLIEIHYTLIEGVNDTLEDVQALVNIFADTGVPIKLLTFSEDPEIDLSRSGNSFIFERKLEDKGVQVVMYTPPGRDIGASCGQFEVRT